jgi:integrase
VTLYFGFSIEMGRVQVSSLKPEAYILREWLTFPLNQNKGWLDGSDRLLRRWRVAHTSKIKSRSISAHQVERKLSCVFQFYRLLPSALILDGDLQPVMRFVGPRADYGSEFFPITSKIVQTKKGDRREVWSGSRNEDPPTDKRTTPSVSQVQKILNYLRGKADQSSLGRSPLMRTLEAERNWLIARCMAAAGLRACEVSALSVRSITEALVKEGIVHASELSRRDIYLDDISDDIAAKELIQSGLDGMKQRHRRNLYIEILGKGNKRRLAPFPVDLIHDILVTGIWFVRHHFISTATSGPPASRRTDNIFLSFKTGSGLIPGAIGDIMKNAFVKVDVSGSGHRLRAHFATVLASELWDECFAMNGYRFDQTIVNMAMDRLAEALGHKKVTTTVRHYLDMALLEQFGASKRENINSLGAIWNSIVRNNRNLSISQKGLVLKLINRLAEMTDGSELQHLIELALLDESFNDVSSSTSKSPSSETGPPKLRLVTSVDAEGP